MSSAPLGIRFVHQFGCSVKNRNASYQLYILLFTFAAYTSYHLSRKPISVVKSVLHQNCTAIAEKHHYNITKYNATFCSWKPFDGDNYSQLLGTLEYAYLFAYAIGMLVSGHIAERLNLRHYLGVGMLLSGATTALFGMGYYLNIHVIEFYVGVQLIGGVVQATGWPAVVTCVGNWFGQGRRGFIMGVWNSHTSVGNILGSFIAGFFVSTAWGLSFIVPGTIIAFFGGIVLLFLVPYPTDVGLPSPHDPEEIVTSCESLTGSTVDLITDEEPLIQGQEESLHKRTASTVSSASSYANLRPVSPLGALKIPGVIEFSLCLFFAKLVSYTFLYWLPAYIKASTTLDPAQSAFFSTLFDLGGIFGGILAGFVSDRNGRRATTCMVMLLLAAPMLIIYENFGNTNTYLSIFLLMVTGGLVNGPYALITTAVSADLGTSKTLQGNSRALATVTAIIDGTGSMGAALGPLLTGLIVPYGWTYVFYMLVTADLLALVLLVRLGYRDCLGIVGSSNHRRVVDEYEDLDS